MNKRKQKHAHNTHTYGTINLLIEGIFWMLRFSVISLIDVLLGHFEQGGAHCTGNYIYNIMEQHEWNNNHCTDTFKLSHHQVLQ
jgi:hypothetical protein